MDREISRLELTGIKTIRSLSQKLLISMLSEFRKGKEPYVALADHLQKMQEIIESVMLAGHLFGELRTARKIKAQKNKMIALSTIDEAINFATQRMNLTPARITEIRNIYGSEAVRVMSSIDGVSQKRLYKSMNKIISENMHVKAGMVELKTAMETAGVTGVKPYLLETAVRTQTKMAYEAGRWNMLQDPDIQDMLWGYEYVCVDDDRSRASHSAMGGTILPKNDPFWRENWPPNGFNCRCSVLEVWDDPGKVSLPKIRHDEFGIPIEAIPDAGWSFNPGMILRTGADDIPKSVRAERAYAPVSRKTDLEKLKSVILKKIVPISKVVDLPYDVRKEIIEYTKYSVTTRRIRNAVENFTKSGVLKKDEYLRQAATIEKAIEATPSFRGSIYRAMYWSDKSDFDKYMKKMTPGKEFSFKTMQSFSGSQSEAMYFTRKDSHNILLKFKNAPKRTMDISNLSVHAFEKEVLVGMNSKYRVVRRKSLVVKGKKVVEITLEEIPLAVSKPLKIPKVIKAPKAPTTAVSKADDFGQSIIDDFAAYEKTGVSELKQKQWIQKQLVLPKNQRGKIARPAKVTRLNPMGARHLDDAENFINSVLSKDIEVKGKYGLHIQEGIVREYYIDGTISIGNSSPTSLVVHEIGHFLQHSSLVLDKEVKRFFAYRTKGEVAQKLNKVMKSEMFGATEITKVDKFINPYMGKIYDDVNNSEILSMALEYLYKDPVKFMQKDPEMFKWIVGLLRGQAPVGKAVEKVVKVVKPVVTKVVKPIPVKVVKKVPPTDLKKLKAVTKDEIKLPVKDWQSMVPQDYKTAIQQYTGNMSDCISTINAVFDFIKGKSISNFGLIRASRLEKFIDAVPKAEGSIYRGLHWKSKNNYNSYMKTMQPGAEFSFKTMQSFSVVKPLAMQFAEAERMGVILKFKNSPIRSADLRGLSRAVFQNEVLVGMNSKYRVVSHKLVESGSKIIEITLEEITKKTLPKVTKPIPVKVLKTVKSVTKTGSFKLDPKGSFLAQARSKIKTLPGVTKAQKVNIGIDETKKLTEVSNLLKSNKLASTQDAIKSYFFKAIDEADNAYDITVARNTYRNMKPIWSKFDG